jgi:hypothetical protein
LDIATFLHVNGSTCSVVKVARVSEAWEEKKSEGFVKKFGKVDSTEGSSESPETPIEEEKAAPAEYPDVVKMGGIKCGMLMCFAPTGLTTEVKSVEILTKVDRRAGKELEKATAVAIAKAAPDGKGLAAPTAEESTVAVEEAVSVAEVKDLSPAA